MSPRTPAGRAIGLSTLVLTVTTAAHADIEVPTDLPLGAAISLATDGEVITILPGTYDASQGFAITDKAITLRGSTGDPADVVLDAFNVGRILEITGTASSGTLLEGLTLTRGLGSDPGGAAVNVLDADVTIDRCVFLDNNSPVQVFGGAIRCEDGSMTILDSHFEGNHADVGGSDGGAFTFFGPAESHLVSGCTFIDNSAANTGGALRIDSSTAQITACRFEDNVASGLDEHGGAVFFRNGADITIDACTFLNNDSGNLGGAVGMLDATASVVIRNSVFQGNTAVVSGGAINTDAGDCIATNCTFESNAAGSYAVLRSVTGGTGAIANAIVWNNTPTGTPAGGASGVSIRWSIVEGGFAGPGNIDADPLFAAAPSGELQLLAGSPAIDAGSTSAYAGPFTDRDGADRGVDDPDTTDTGEAVAGPVIDMGAFEYQVADAGPSCPGDLDGNGVVETSDFLALLGAWGVCP